MTTGVQTKPKTIANPVAEERPIHQVVKEAVQFTQTRLDALCSTPDQSGPLNSAASVAEQERRWPLAIGLSMATAASAGLWYGLWVLIAH